jgi:hypothetical protein
MKYREKPATVEAVKYQPGVIMPSWFADRVKDNVILVKNDGTCDINTSEGVLTSNPGDYIIFDINGKVYPCRPEIFERAFERVVGRSERNGRVATI